ncbi:MAG: amino acid permease [Candidatus Berkiella sp.]
MSVKNSVGAVLLIIGTSVGAAVLALPIATAQLGFIGATLTYLLCWFFMTIGALCVLEANLSAGFGTNMVSMSELYLGKMGKWITWGTYLILFYALSASYLTGASSWVMHFFEYFQNPISSNTAAIIATISIMAIIFCGTYITDLINRILMLGLFAAFILLSLVTMQHVEPELLFAIKPQFDLQPLPLIITAFGYAIIVPTLTHYLQGNHQQLYRVIIVGSIIPLLMYLLWELLILGTLPFSGDISLTTVGMSNNPVTELPKQLNQKFNHPFITQGMSYFSVFALFTSILGVCLSLFDFLADGLKIKRNLGGKIGLSAITFLPPLLFVYLFPQGFTFALSFAGIFVSLLLGILPALMVWRLSNHQSEKKIIGWVGNKALLSITILFFLIIIAIECYNVYELIY